MQIGHRAEFLQAFHLGAALPQIFDRLLQHALEEHEVADGIPLEIITDQRNVGTIEHHDLAAHQQGTKAEIWNSGDQAKNVSSPLML